MIVKLTVILLILSVVHAEKNYTDFVKNLKTNIENQTGEFYHSAYNRLAYISDTYGPRMWGGQTLEMVISQVQSMAKKDGFDNVHLEPVNFKKWVRGREQLTLYDPRPTPQKLAVIGLGRSISGDVRADVIVVKTFDELQKRKDEVKGKIVVYNQEWTNYYDTVEYRVLGAQNAAKYGAVAALVRSIASHSIYSPHAGGQYNQQVPVAAIAVEDAEMLQRMQDRGQKISLHLVLENQQFPDATSNNLIFQIQGTEKPDEILLMGGHIDSWDTGSQTGANDDGGGFLTCYEAMRLLLKLNRRPKRTLRFIAWSGEEFNDPKSGHHAYQQAHLAELPKHIVAFEDDLGSTKLKGFGYIGDPKGMQIVKAIGETYMGILNASIVNDKGEAVDTGPLFDKGVPTMANVVTDDDSHDYYFSYHHSAGDSMSVMNPDDMDSNVAGVAAMFFILADLDDTIPRPTSAGHLRSN